MPEMVDAAVDGSQSSAREEETTKQSQSTNQSSSNTAENPNKSTTNAATLQRVLNSPRNPPASLDGVLEGSREKLTKSGTQSPSWPTSPRLKSPPPNVNRSTVRKELSDQAQSNTAIKRLAPVSAPELAAAMLIPDGQREISQTSSQTRGPPRGTSAQNPSLDTVAEDSVHTTPVSKSKVISQIDPGLDTRTNSSSAVSQIESSRSTSNTVESESRARALSASKPASNLAKRSFTSLTGGKKPVTEPARTLTVETEPVGTITTGIGDRNRDGGSVRTKTSTETIRPKKEKKKPTRKPTSHHPGTAASKADIFEAKVASAVDEVDTDDSDETFVYESNPPEPRAYRHHSRTPSSTSMASTHDQNRTNKHGIRSGSNAIPGKKSMKFGNSMHRAEYDEDPSRSRTTNSTPRHHHIGRHGRTPHASIFDSDSPFSQTRQASPRTGNAYNKNSRSNSPRVANGHLRSPRKFGVSAYDNNEDIADDERAPLMGTVRVNRNRHSRRPNSRDIHGMDYDDEPESTFCSRWCGWLMILILLFLVCCSMGTVIMGLNRSLMEVEIRKITNVLVSEQELMLDLDVRAINPNLIAVTVTDLDVQLFAQSPYVGTSESWHREHPNNGLRLGFSERRKRSWFWPDPEEPKKGVDEGTDPDDPEGSQKMLLGGVSAFDSPLVFEASPFKHEPSDSAGEIRLAKPGNKTETGGSARWERVILHDFDLIVRGVIKYQMPLSTKIRSAKIIGRKTVHPDSEDKEAHSNSTG